LKSLPFLAKFHDSLREGRKTLTIRSKRYGAKGDRFDVPGSNPPLVVELRADPYPIALGDVATKRWKEEGCESTLDFIETWDSLHPVALFDPSLVRFAHELRVVDAKPTVAWQPHLAALVDERGDALTDAQDYKADKYIELGLITVGDDGGCFAAALQAVRSCGGVIEHPQGSNAWRHFRLPIPEGRGWTVADAFGGRSCYVDQGAYGHKAKKPTWLYAVLPAFPKMDWTRVWDRPYVMPGGYHSARERARAKARVTAHHATGVISREERYLTPTPFKDALLQLAASCHGWKPRHLQMQEPLRNLEPKA
jgi:hypothetical protein